MEPHSNSKIEEGRLRLISSIALVDQVVDRVLFTTWQRTEIKNCLKIAGKTGWSPMPLGYHHLYDAFPGQVLATDCSAFDWTFPEWLHDLTLDIRLDQTAGHIPAFENAARSRWREVLGDHCTIRLPYGKVYRQTIRGIMKSGWLLTISGNSQAQELITLLAYKRARPGKPLPRLWSMGDDVLMSWDGSDSGDLEREIRRVGILNKFSVPSAEFSGFKFEGDSINPIVNPIYAGKHQFLLAHVSEEDLQEVVTAYSLLYALSNEDQWLRPYLEKYSRWSKPVSRAWAQGLVQDHLLRLQSDVAGKVFPF